MFQPARRGQGGEVKNMGSNNLFMGLLGQGSLEYILLLAGALLVAGTVVYILSGTTDTQISVSQAESQAYWNSASYPIRISESTQVRPSPCPLSMPAGTAGYGLALSNADSRETVVLTGVIMDGINRTFCLAGRNTTSSVRIDPNKEVTITVNYTKNCQSGMSHEIALNFTYNKGTFTNRTQVGAKKLVLACN